MEWTAAELLNFPLNKNRHANSRANQKAKNVHDSQGLSTIPRVISESPTVIAAARSCCC